jgi:hypothetical protein
MAMLRRSFDAACLRMGPLVGNWRLALALGGLGLIAAMLIAIYV